MEPGRLERQAGGVDLRHVGGADELRIEELIEVERAGSTLALGELLRACRSFLLNADHHRVSDLLQARTGATDLVQGTSQERVERAIGMLPADQRQVILLRNRDHLTLGEIGLGARSVDGRRPQALSNYGRTTSK